MTKRKFKKQQEKLQKIAEYYVGGWNSLYTHSDNNETILLKNQKINELQTTISTLVSKIVKLESQLKKETCKHETTDTTLRKYKNGTTQSFVYCRICKGKELIKQNNGEK